MSHANEREQDSGGEDRSHPPDAAPLTSDEREELRALREEVAALRQLVEERLGAPPSINDTATLPPGFKISNARYRKAESIRRELLDTLAGCGWNKSEAARILGISRVSVWRRMRQLGVPLAPPTKTPRPPQAATDTPLENTPQPASRRPTAPTRPKRPLDLSWD